MRFIPRNWSYVMRHLVGSVLAVILPALASSEAPSSAGYDSVAVRLGTRATNVGGHIRFNLPCCDRTVMEGDVRIDPRADRTRRRRFQP